MTLQEYCILTKNSTNKLCYIFKDKTIIDEKIKAKTIYDFIQLQCTEVVDIKTMANTDFITLDLNFSEHCELVK